MPNPFAHVELSTDDVKKAKKFYQALFAWKLSDIPEFGYTMIDVGGGAGGGMQKKQMPEAPTAWLPYVGVEDVKAVMAKAVKAGATAIVTYHEVGSMGAIGIFKDPAGAMLGLWEQAKAPAAAAPPLAAKKGTTTSDKKKVAAPEPAQKASGKKGPAAPALPSAAPSAKKVDKKAASPDPLPAAPKKAPKQKAALPASSAAVSAKKAPGKKK